MTGGDVEGGYTWPACLTAEDIAVIKANSKRMAAKEMPDEMFFQVSRIWNSSRRKAAATRE